MRLLKRIWGWRTGRRLEEIAGRVEKRAEHLSGYGGRHGERSDDTPTPDPGQRLLGRSPAVLFNREMPCSNPAFVQLLKLTNGTEVADDAWHKILAEALVEASSVPGAAQVFERQAYVEDYLSELTRKHRARYAPGWINLDDALFLYWLIRLTKPRRIVQCSAFNGRSSAYMMLALAKNGSEGTLSIIDQPAIFDPADRAWMIEDKVYGAVVPAGKTTAWMVPDHYRDRLDIRIGAPRNTLPTVVDQIDGIDLFYYAGDHAYQDMMWAFDTVKPKLRPGGLVVAVDVGWNASLWTFAEGCNVPSYTFKGAVGVAFL